MYRQNRPNRQNNSRPKHNFQKAFAHQLENDKSLVRKIKEIQSLSKIVNHESEETVYVPRYQFSDFPIIEALKRNISEKNYILPTPIQDQAIIPILDGKDIIGIANTGTGKTAAFLIPLIHKVVKNKEERVFIVTPTRELAFQINEEFRFFAKGLGIYSALCIGGMNMKRQKEDLRRNPNFVIGTPGRIKDHIQEKSLNLSQFHSVVLDETDRMVDIGFIVDIKYFISLLPFQRQSLFFSATVSDKVKEIISVFVKNPETISVKQNDIAETIDQDIINFEPSQKKIDILHDLLIKEGFDKVLIFGRTKHGIQKLADELDKRGFKVGAIHGNKNQSQRLRILEQFKSNQVSILLATDVASRGLDIKDVTHVINYDLPSTLDDYIHRIGRTGRANKKGKALTFIESSFI